MSTSKSQKAELVAIYRLEFYKKQSNWKLSSSKKAKNPEKTVVKEILNTTYNVEEKSKEKDLSDPLNVAFVDSDSDKHLKLTKSPNSPELSREWQEPVNIWPQTGTHNNTIDNIKPALRCTRQRLENLQRAADLANLENIENKNTDHPENVQNWNEWPQNINLPNNGMSPQNVDAETNFAHSSQNRNTLSNFTIPPQDIDSATNFAECPQKVGEGLGWNDFGEFEGNWPFETAIWVGAGHMAQEAENLDVVDGNTPDIYAGEWPLLAPLDELPWSRDMEGDMSVDSAGEFMRGADGVPHSSEIDLSLPNYDMDADSNLLSYEEDSLKTSMETRESGTGPSVRLVLSSYLGVKACDVSFNSLSRLSSEQLVLAARLHSRVLRRLLLESQMRQKLRSTQSLSATDFSYEEFPTRDVGPTGQSTENLSLKDVIIAGSHKNVAGVGRGRGRLPNSLKP